MAWAGFFMYEQAIVLFTDTTKYNLLLSGPAYLFNVAFFYINSNFLLPRLYSSSLTWVGRYIVAAAALLAIYGVLRCEVYLHLAPLLGIETPGPTYSYQLFWVLAIYRGTFFLLASISYRFSLNAVRLEKQKREHEQRLLISEKGLMEAQLSFLKNQINPHFLFNTLNFMYSQVYPHSENSARGILLLAETMRYALQEEDSGKVILDQEVKHLHNYIALNQLRFNHQLHIIFQEEGLTQFLMIIPLVLLTFVENCFKHGQLDDAAFPLRLHLNVVQNHLTFQTYNKKRPGPKELSTGIGLTNTLQRLELMYADRYTLTILDEEDQYTCTLQIAL